MLRKISIIATLLLVVCLWPSAAAAQFAFDDFTDTGGDIGLHLHAMSGGIAGSWTNHPSLGNVILLIDASNSVTTDIQGVNSIYYTSHTPPDADYDVEVDLVLKTDLDDLAGPVCRMDTASTNRYYARYNQLQATPLLELIKIDTGVETVLDSDVQTLSQGTTHNLRIRCHGSNFTVYLNDSPIMSATDSTFSAAGRAAIYMRNSSQASDTTGMHIDNFRADDTTAGGVTGPPVGSHGLLDAGR